MVIDASIPSSVLIIAIAVYYIVDRICDCRERVNKGRALSEEFIKKCFIPEPSSIPQMPEGSEVEEE